MIAALSATSEASRTNKSPRAASPNPSSQRKSMLSSLNPRSLVKRAKQRRSSLQKVSPYSHLKLKTIHDTTTRIRTYRVALGLLALVTLTLIIIMSETDGFPKEPGPGYGITISVLIVTLIGQFCLYRVFVMKTQRLKLLDTSFTGKSMIDSPFFARWIVESLIWWVHCPPGLHLALEHPKSLMLVAGVRLYALLFMFKEFSIVLQFVYRCVAHLAKVKLSTSLVLRTQLHLHPIMSTIVGYVMTWVLLALVYRAIEESSMADSMWFIFVTSTTVGYGDITPERGGGRVVAIVAMGLGLMVTAWVIAAVQTSLGLTDTERRVLASVRHSREEKQLKNDSARLIQWVYRRARIEKHGYQARKHLPQPPKNAYKITKLIRSIHDTKRNIELLEAEMEMAEQIVLHTKIDHMEAQLGMLSENMGRLMKHFDVEAAQLMQEGSNRSFGARSRSLVNALHAFRMPRPGSAAGSPENNARTATHSAATTDVNRKDATAADPADIELKVRGED